MSAADDLWRLMRAPWLGPIRTDQVAQWDAPDGPDLTGRLTDVEPDTEGSAVSESHGSATSREVTEP